MIIREQLEKNQKNHKNSLKNSQQLSKSLFLAFKMKHFAKKIEQKMSIDSPAEIFITIYTEKIQNEKRVKKDVKRIIFKAVGSENR